MGIKGLGAAPLTGGTQRPVLQCNAMKLHLHTLALHGIARHCTALHGIAREWMARQDAAVWCPLSPHCPCSPATPPTHTGDIACLSDPEHISLTSPELNQPYILLFPAKVAS